jgi:hypothetical protein
MSRRRNQIRTTAIAFLLAVFGISTGVNAFETDFSNKAVPLLRKFCGDCHAGNNAEARIDLTQLSMTPRFGAKFRTWEKMIVAIRNRKMPPKTMPQPSTQQRKTIIKAIEGALGEFIRKNAGDPGPVVMRRLTSAEYAYTIQDLTGLDLSLERSFINDAVGGEGFTNVGRVQFMQDSALERYLEAAKKVASHAVIGSGPLTFYPDPGKTGFELSAITRIQQIYRQHGFRTGAGEGAEPFGLEMYSKTFYVAWQYRHRNALGLKNISLEKLAKSEGLSVRFVKHVWAVLNNSRASFPSSVVRTQWLKLLAPVGDRKLWEKKGRSGCDGVYRGMRSWQRVLAAATGDEEEAAVLTAGELHVKPLHTFKAKLDWAENATKAMIELSVSSATNEKTAGSIVIWKNARIRFRRENRRWLPSRLLSDVLSPASRKRLQFGRHPAGGKIGKNDFVLVAPSNLSLEFKVPASTTTAELLVETELDRREGAGTPVRCTISDGAVDGETVAESGGHSALLVDPKLNSYKAWTQGVLEFALNLPEVSHREPAPSDRDPIPAPFDGTYNSTERNLFHYLIKYHRDDDFLVKHVLDDTTRRKLDQAWTDLFVSFEYHDAWLRFVARKFKIDLKKRTIANLDDEWIGHLPKEQHAFVKRLRENYMAGQRRLRAAQSGHVEDALRTAERAWRRPLTKDEKHRLRTFYKTLRQKAGLSHAKAIRTLLSRIWVAPAFLYRVEPAIENRGIVPLSDWELASRLSYFLTSSAPDAELRRVAESGRLKNPTELARQARRLLGAPKARRFATEFFGQWFGFYRFDQYRGIDSKRFPEFTDSLKASMYDEAVSFFEHIIRKDRPVREILFADYAFLNRQLARHYAMDVKGISEKRPQYVEITNKFQRGGLLRLGAVLTVTSAPLRTSPVKRGDWILRRVLGTPVPPPPADAGSISADDVGADGKTIRTRLEAHRRNPTCANCHSRIDPLGFSLEHFDPIGRWRDRYRDKQPINSSGILSDGTKISGPNGLRRYLQKNEKQFRRTLCSKLLGYALGRAEIASDRPLIGTMMKDLDDDGRFSKLVIRIVTSRQFRHQRTGEPKASATGTAKQKGADRGKQ